MKLSIWTGAAWEDWSAQSPMEGGIGGSETAAIHMGKELAARGHEVEIWGQFHRGTEGKVDGVNYLQHSQVMDPGQIECDVFISSRDVNAMLLRPKARTTALWVHDINVGFDGNKRLDAFDTILCLSDWSARAMLAFYPHLRKERIWVTRNGIELKRFRPELTIEDVIELKNGAPRFTYSSSPDRGLDRLLDFWPKIREIAPGAELHVYYGFDNWRKMAAGNSGQMARIDWLGERMHRFFSQGVKYHGRVGQMELADSFLKSCLWLYPSDFKETSCQTAMEAQAAGAVPICTDLAALSETVKHGILIKPFNHETRYEKDFLTAFEQLIRSPEMRFDLASKGRKHALENLSWAQVAQEWESHFQGKLT